MFEAAESVMENKKLLYPDVFLVNSVPGVFWGLRTPLSFRKMMTWISLQKLHNFSFLTYGVNFKWLCDVIFY